MADYNLHRKIFEDPDNSTEAAQICTFQCDPLKNPSFNCIPICSFICPWNCNTTDSSPPPPLVPETDGYIFSTPPEHHHSSLSLPLKISLVILVLTFSFFLLYTLYKFYTVWYRSRRRRSPPNPENQETHDEFIDHDVLDHPIWYIRTTGLQPSVIDALTVVNFNKDAKIVEGTDCSVCLTEFEEDDTLRLLPYCNHAFHMSCIDTWLRSHTNCPLCRCLIVKDTVDASSSDQLISDSETNLGISSIRNGDRGEASGSSGLRVGEADADDLNNNSLKIGDL